MEANVSWYRLAVNDTGTCPVIRHHLRTECLQFLHHPNRTSMLLSILHIGGINKLFEDNLHIEIFPELLDLM